jgi:hypothetical protein
MGMAQPDSPGRSQQRRRAQRSPRLLHHLAALLSLAGQRAAAKENSPSCRAESEVRPSATQRRRRQHLALARRLLDPLPPALLPADRQAERFWSALRWGGMGLLLALWLNR